MREDSEESEEPALEAVATENATPDHVPIVFPEREDTECASEEERRALEGVVHTLEDGVHTLEEGTHTQEDGVHSLEEGIHTQEDGVHTLEGDMHSLEDGVHTLEERDSGAPLSAVQNADGDRTEGALRIHQPKSWAPPHHADLSLPPKPYFAVNGGRYELSQTPLFWLDAVFHDPAKGP